MALGLLILQKRGKPKVAEITKKLAFIEGMRAVSAIYVVISHIGNMIDPRAVEENITVLAPWFRDFMSLFYYGHLAVAAFIVLSGFSLQFGLYQREDGRVYGLGKFYLRRALRILPAYYAALVFSIAICYWVTIPHMDTRPFSSYLPLSGSAREPILGDMQTEIVRHAGLYHNWFLSSMFKINGAMWSIPIEVQLYLIFPFLILVMQKKSPLALLVMVGIPAALVLALSPNAAKMYSWFAVLFAFGMISAHFAYRPHLRIGQKPKTGLYFSALAVVITVFICTTRLGYKQAFSIVPLVSSDMTFGLAVATFLYSACTWPGSVMDRFFAWMPFVKIGVFSYSIYLLHHPLIQVLHTTRPAWFSDPNLAGVYLLTLGMAAILGFCYLFSLVFEKPFVKSSLDVTHHVGETQITLPLRPVTFVGFAPDAVLLINGRRAKGSDVLTEAFLN